MGRWGGAGAAGGGPGAGGGDPGRACRAAADAAGAGVDGIVEDPGAGAETLNPKKIRGE